MDTATAAVEPLQYQLRSHGVVTGGSAQLQVLRHRQSRQTLCKGWFGEHPDLDQLASQFGFRGEDVELAEDEQTWRIDDL